MKSYYSGTSGTISLNGSQLTDVSEWSIEGNQSLVESTTLGDRATTFRHGRVSYLGSLTILAAEGENTDIAFVASSLMRTAFSPNPSIYNLLLRTNGSSRFGTLRCQALFENIVYESKPGALISAIIDFRVTGLLTEYDWSGTRTLEFGSGNFALAMQPNELRVSALILDVRAIVISRKDIAFNYRVLALDALELDISAYDVNLNSLELETLALTIAANDNELVID